MLCDKLVKLFGTHENALLPLPAASDYIQKLPTNSENLEIISSEMSQMNSDEMSRFESWESKGAAVLGATGLLLSLVPLGLPIIAEEITKHNSVYAIAVSAIFSLTVCLYFMATFYAIQSLRPRPISRVDDGMFLDSAVNQTVDFKRVIVAEKIVVYKINTNVVNIKATDVNTAMCFFFYACIFQTAFITMTIIKSTYLLVISP